MSYSSATTIKTVFSREIQVSLRSKAIMISLGIILVVMLGAIAVVGFLTGGDAEDKGLVVVGAQSEQFESDGVAVASSDDASAAEEMVREGDTDGAVIKTGSGYEFLYKGTPDPELSALVTTAVGTASQNEALEKVGVSPEEFAAAMPNAEVDMRSVEDATDQNIESIITTLVAVSLMSYFIILFAGNIGGRVTEEKSSRVVEIILASARPMDLLAGKILANAVFGFIATAILLTVGSIGLSMSGILDGVSFDYSVIPVMLVAFPIGLLLFGSLYAAAGSLVSRTEDLQSTQAPILMLIFGMIYAPMFGWANLDSTVIQVLTWIPPFSLSLAPMQLAAGNMNLLQVFVVFAITLVATSMITALVARIYRNAILHNGRKLSWMKAIKG